MSEKTQQPIPLEPLLKACYNYKSNGMEIKGTVVISPIRIAQKSDYRGDYTQITWACSRGYHYETQACIYSNHHRSGL